MSIETKTLFWTAACLAVVLAASAVASSGGEAEPAAPEWLAADGRPVSGESTSPEGAMRWAELLAAEGSYAAASRAYENLVRCWPAAPEAPAAMSAAVRSALAGGDFDRAERLLTELRGRWRTPDRAPEQDAIAVLLGEARLAAAASGRLSSGEAAAQARRAQATFGVVLEQDRAGPSADRAALGRARAMLALGRTKKGIEALERFLKDYPRSPFVPDARNELAAAVSTGARGRPPERSVLEEARESTEWAGQQAAPDGDRPQTADAIAETYRSIAARQAELKMDEARLYLRLRQRRAAETVLRSILGRYGDTPSADAAAKLLEELARE